MFVRSELPPTAEDLSRAERSVGFTAGFCVACVELARTHGEDQLAAYLLADSGITYEQAKAAGLDDDDMAVLKSLLETST
jgi:enoyl-CoA hydratase/carnithine racemase